MKINNFEEYHGEEMLLFTSTLARIRTFLAVIFFAGIIILNYLFLPSLFIFPWILFAYVIYTIYKLIYPFSVFGYFGKNIEHKAKAKLIRDVNTTEDQREQFIKEFWEEKA